MGVTAAAYVVGLPHASSGWARLCFVTRLPNPRGLRVSSGSVDMSMEHQQGPCSARGGARLVEVPPSGDVSPPHQGSQGPGTLRRSALLSCLALEVTHVPSLTCSARTCHVAMAWLQGAGIFILYIPRSRRKQDSVAVSTVCTSWLWDQWG